MILFPLYMTIVIALKSPSEMTNDVAGALSLPKSFSFSNFREAMKVTNFWSSLTNSIIITGASILISLVIHSMAGYALGRAMNRFKKFKVIYYYIVSGMFVPFAILMMPLVKETATIGIDNMFGVIVLYVVFYMPMNVMLYSGYLKNVPLAMEEAADIDGASAWRTYWTIIFPMMKPMHATVAILTALGTWNDVMTPLVIMSGSEKTTLPLAQQFPDSVRNELQPCFRILPACSYPDLDLLHSLSEAHYRRRCKRCGQGIIKNFSHTYLSYAAVWAFRPYCCKHNN